MADLSPTLDAWGVAELLSITKDDFLRRRPRLQRVHGFPKVLPGLGRVWSRAAVQDWIARFGANGDAGELVQAIEPDKGAPALPTNTVDPVERARQRLEDKYVGRAA